MQTVLHANVRLASRRISQECSVVNDDNMEVEPRLIMLLVIQDHGLLVKYRDKVVCLARLCGSIMCACDTHPSHSHLLPLRSPVLLLTSWQLIHSDIWDIQNKLNDERSCVTHHMLGSFTGINFTQPDFLFYFYYTKHFFFKDTMKGDDCLFLLRRTHRIMIHIWQSVSREGGWMWVYHQSRTCIFDSLCRYG